MNLQFLPHRRVASPPLSPAVRNDRLPAATPRPWPDLSPEARKSYPRVARAGCESACKKDPLFGVIGGFRYRQYPASAMTFM
jgi:hypothetical protein